MGTRAAAFTAKIHNLQHYNARIKHNLVPLPSGDDVANTLKYFSQTLLSVLKDVPSISLDVLRSPEKDSARTSLFPSLDYKTLHQALVELVDAVPLVQHGAHALGSTILHTLACLVPFLEHDLMDTLPYLVASAMTLFPCSLHKDIIDVLCHHLIPFTFRTDPKDNSDSYASMSTAAVLMMIFQYTDCTAFHCQVLECYMSLKKDIIKDLLTVIAHGTAKARCHAVELLFQYLPTLNPALLDRKGIGWKPLMCQRENCLSTSSNEAIKMCFEHSVVITSGEHPPPLYMCEACAEQVELEHGPENLVDVLLPMDKVSATCEDPDCKATDKSVVAICFSIECAKRNGHRPVRYCSQCVSTYHNDQTGGDHMIHTTIPSPWSMDLETQSYMVEAVISLLREAEPLNEKHVQESLNGQDDREESHEMTVVEERQLLSRYGIWLLVGLCTPNENTPDESLGRLLSMLFQWFHYTACLPDDQAGNALERLKAEYIHGWLMEVVKNHFDVFVSCLLPHPKDYAKVGGHWESWPCYPVQIKEGFKRLLCLVPYDIITLEVWEYIMPYWMDAFRHEAVEAEFAELKILLSRVLDPDLSPLGFDTKQMYKFLSMRFQSTSSPVQEQALYWLQILTMLEVPVPMELLYEMFMNGVASITTRKEHQGLQTSLLISSSVQDSKSTERSHKTRMTLVNVPKDENPLLDVEYKSDAEIDLPCYILMLDILIKQLELQEIPLHKGFDGADAQNVLLLVKALADAPWEGSHSCQEPGEGSQCLFCEVCAIFFQLALMLVEYFSPVMEVTMADVPSEDVVPDSKLETSPQKVKTEVQLEPESHSPHKEELGSTSSKDSTEIPLVASFGEKPSSSEKNAVLQGDAGTAATSSSVDEAEGSSHFESQDNMKHTTPEKCKFAMEELPPQLQLFHVLLKDLSTFEDADVLYHILSCLKVMCLHSEVLNKAAHNHRDFLIWCQENILVTNLWKLLQVEFSHIAQLVTGLLLHSITLPSGSSIFWKILEKDFHNEDWRTRYAAVEKVTMIAHFVDPSTVKNSPLLQSALAGAFCYLVHSLDDEQPTISQRALLNLESLKTPSLKLFVWCMEVQFDSCIPDRPMVLQTVLQIHNHLTGKRFLNWDFFLNRFDTLFLEDQIRLENLGEISYVRDLKNTNVNSEMFQRKLKRAHEALSCSLGTRSLASSFGDIMPYKRIASVPSSVIFRPDKLDREKSYERQSAPVLKRKSSRLVGSMAGTGGPLQHFPNSFFIDGHLKDTVQEESHFLTVLYRAMDTEEHDNETLHLLIFLLMQFLSRPDPIHRSDDKITRSQHIVLRHLNILLGYSQNQGEGRFLLPPHKIRSSAIFSTFLLCMPKVLDNNFTMGTFLLPMCMSVLVCCPSPLKYPSEHYPPTYSLWLLDPFCRHSWLQSTLVIMYKYHYDTFPFTRSIQWLILIVLSTLKAQRHRCKQVHEPLLSPLPSRARDFAASCVEMEHVLERDKDGSFDTSSLHEDGSRSFRGKTKFSGSKMNESVLDQQTPKQIGKEKSHQWKSWKSGERSCSSEGEDAEPELEAIPESPKSESSEMEHFQSDLCYPPLSDLACSKPVEDLVYATETIPAASSWTKAVDELALVSNSDGSNPEEKLQSLVDVPQSSVSSEAENISIVEKSAVEIMEKYLFTEDIPKDQVSKEGSKSQPATIKRMSQQYSLPEKDPLPMSFPSDNILNEKQQPTTVSPEIQVNENIDVKKYNMPFHLTKQFEGKEDVSRMKSLPFESNKHQSVARSKTDSNILDLPQLETKASHSRYPHSMFSSKKSSQSKISRQAEILGSENLTVPIFRPPLERLLPIGLPEREKLKRSETLAVPPVEHMPLRHQLSVDHNLSRDSFLSRDLCEDKGVQTGNVDPLFDIPAPERLLPVGPKPTKKDCFPPLIKQEPKQKVEDISPMPVQQKPNEDSKKDDTRVDDEDEKIVKDASKKHTTVDPTLNKNLKNETILPVNEPKSSGTEVEKSALGAAMKSENFPNRIFDFTSDISQPASAFGVFDVCKITMDMKTPDLVSQDKKHPKDGESTDNLASFSSEKQINEKIELSTFSEVTLQKSLEKAFEEETKCRLPYRQRKQRKSGLGNLEAQRSFDHQNAGARRMKKTEVGSGNASKRTSGSTRSSHVRPVDDQVIERCTECGVGVEEYNDEEIGLCIVILATFVHREPAMAAPLLPKMLRVVARIASTPNYPWQSESNVHLPGGSVSIARQFLRCTLHQLAPNGIFVQIFQSHVIEPEFYRTMALALADFAEVNQVAPLLMLFENLNERKHLHHEVIFHMLDNVAVYLDCLPLESGAPPWPAFLQQLDLFLRKLLLTLAPGPVELHAIIQIILCALKLPVIKEAKSILDPFSKILSHAILNSPLDYNQLSELCTVCNRNVRDRDKQLLTRTTVFELVQALKFKTSVPDANLLTLVQFVLADCGGRLAPNVILDGMPVTFESQSGYKTMAGECMQQYLTDALEFVADVHTLNKVKNMLYGPSTHLNEETLGGHLKAGISQFLAIEFSKNNGRDNRAISRYLPWLYHPPTTLQQGPKEFMDCVSHIRLLSWLLLGALTHSALMQSPSACQPIPLEANGYIAEHIQLILAGFSEQSKVSVLHMSSLFHAFILCQLWTMYCEYMVALNPPGSEQNQICGLTLTDFWAKVTPGILQLVCHSKVLSEMVSLHFLSLMEALQECNSTILARLLPMWTPVMYSFQGHLSGNLGLRLQGCVSCPPPPRSKEEVAGSSSFLRWLQRLQFKMGQIELQSSNATQFYSL